MHCPLSNEFLGTVSRFPRERGYEAHGLWGWSAGRGVPLSTHVPQDGGPTLLARRRPTQGCECPGNMGERLGSVSVSDKCRALHGVGLTGLASLGEGQVREDRRIMI